MVVEAVARVPCLCGCASIGSSSNSSSSSRSSSSNSSSVCIYIQLYIYIYIYIIYELFEDGYESSVILIRCSMLPCDDEPTPN